MRTNHAESYLQGNYEPSLLEFYRTLVYIALTLKWNVLVVFDGVETDLKQHEYARRQSKRKAATTSKNKVRNKPLYISMAAKICEKMKITFIVAAQEADSQCRFVQINDERPTLVVTGG